VAGKEMGEATSSSEEEEESRETGVEGTTATANRGQGAAEASLDLPAAVADDAGRPRSPGKPEPYHYHPDGVTAEQDSGGGGGFIVVVHQNPRPGRLSPRPLLPQSIPTTTSASRTDHIKPDGGDDDDDWELVHHEHETSDRRHHHHSGGPKQRSNGGGGACRPNLSGLVNLGKIPSRVSHFLSPSRDP